jgi:hypothetical protein
MAYKSSRTLNWRKLSRFRSDRRGVYRFLSPLGQRPRRAIESGNKRQFVGEASALNLIEWLNQESPPELGKNTAASRRRVLDLIGNVHNALTAIKEWPSFDLVPTRRVGRLADELNARLSEYPTITIFSPDYDSWLIEDGAMGGKYPDGESLAVHSVIRLAETRLFYRIADCECGRWFFSRFAHQHFCSERCRKRHHEQSEEYKAGRREYMRRYYRLKVSGKVK